MALNACTQNCSNTDGFPYETIAMEAWSPWNAASDYFIYNPWIFSLLGSGMVGLAGVFPLFVIPIDQGVDLKNGASAGTLKMLLSFAVGGLLGDVFLHLLPEAWETDRLKTETATEPSIPCGLWVLSGFLVFIIVEKIFTFEGEIETEIEIKDTTKSNIKSQIDTRQKENACSLREKQLQEFPVGINSLKHNPTKEIENNNFITVNGMRNGFCKRYERPKFSKDVIEDHLVARKTKNGFVQTTNGYKKLHANGCTLRSVLNDKIERNNCVQDSKCLSSIKQNNSSHENTENSCRIEDSLARIGRKISKSLEKSESTHKIKEKSKHITGYLNLLANIIDNFTHGLAVGGSFLISFRLGALTTFAILVHEIPHEIGDFAILLRSGFNRWDAARAQLFTAGGGILGALAAVAFSGGGIEARTSWILPFTAGGFLHIGMVTILPELLKESSPKESLKQLGALFFGIMLMGLLTILCD